MNSYPALKRRFEQMKPEPPSPTVFNTPSNKRGAASLPGAVSAELLFGGAKEIVIRHQGDDYRLRITRNDKLILTK